MQDLRPNLKQSLFADGKAALEAKEYDKALRIFRLGLSVFPGVDFLNNVAYTNLQKGDFVASIKDYEEVMKQTHGEKKYNACLTIAAAWRDAGDPDKALEYGFRAVKMRPRDYKGHYNLARFLEAKKEYKQAEKHFLRAIALKPDLIDAYLGMAILYQTMEEYDTALEFLTKHKAKLDKFPEIHNYIGTYTAFQKGDWQGAVECYKTSLERKPDYAGALTNLGIAKLTLGQLNDGWKFYAHRFAIPDSNYVHIKHPYPEWTGQDFKPKNNVLVWGDQGIGDVLLFTPMVLDLQKEVKKVSMEVNSRLVPLYKRSFPGMDIYPLEKPLNKELLKNKFDWFASSIDLGMRYRDDIKKFPLNMGWLKADRQRASALQAIYDPTAMCPVIGLSWKSLNPGVKNYKSLTVKEMKPIFDAFPNARFVHLQFSAHTDEILELKEILGDRYVIDGAIDTFKDIDGLAAQIAACDCIVGPSNTNMHIAGAMGVPAYMLLSKGGGTLWYWFTEGNTTPWYASVNKFYREINGTWDAPMGHLIETMKKQIYEKQIDKTSNEQGLL